MHRPPVAARAPAAKRRFSARSLSIHRKNAGSPRFGSIKAATHAAVIETVGCESSKDRTTISLIRSSDVRIQINQPDRVQSGDSHIGMGVRGELQNDISRLLSH